jgi:hypothetical protein
MIDLATQTRTKCLAFIESGWNGSDFSVFLDAARELAAAGVLLAVEGPNEPNNWCLTYNDQVGGGGVGNCQAHSWVPVAELQRDLYMAVKADPVLKDYPVFTVSYGGGETDNAGLQFLTIPAGADALMPADTKFADFANLHAYGIIQESGWSNVYRDNQVWDHLDPLHELKGDFGSTWNNQYAGYTDDQLLTLPRVITETGWTGDYADFDQGKFILNIYLTAFKRGYKYTFYYQLVDNEGGFQNIYGIYQSDYSTPKKPAIYLHNLTTILADTVPIPMPQLQKIDFSISNGPATMHDLLLQKSNGDYFLILWNDQGNDHPLRTDAVTVNLGGIHESIKIYDPTMDINPSQTLARVSSVDLELTDHPLVLEISGPIPPLATRPPSVQEGRGLYYDDVRGTSDLHNSMVSVSIPSSSGRSVRIIRMDGKVMKSFQTDKSAEHP